MLNLRIKSLNKNISNKNRYEEIKFQFEIKYQINYIL